MRKILSVIIVLALIVMAFEASAAENQSSTRTVVLQKRSSQGSTPIRDIDLDPEGRRLPSKPIICTIDTGGIEMEGINPSEIYQYDVCDLEGEIMVSFSSEPEFIQYVLTSTEEIGIRLYTEDYIYLGYTSE